ncbi:tubulin-like doman-containing protein [Streptomyces genisteinicus]|uniref:Tubulin-like doman-containing protein n=1 Tax=Streptomyces genisteinicus TaxID=2768068 RepID=A0A7H0HU80_9ACTN|nr:tubulin-like doman-containing protein [Streptomyces genisteinicus]QNP64096.1 tubulin-like doman-containing protein [Streptomyces genisteinicus]
MKIFQPMLFVGLGGTGGLVGAELERKLRAELCGPDGTALGHLSGHAPYQLPECLQFVYADYSESDLQRLPQFNVDPSLRAAYSRTSRATHNLLPNFDSSPEVTKMLRASLRDEVADWLPPRIDEPKVTPLHNGAGQLPTVGRAALFATLRHSLAPVLEPLLQAIDAIARSAGELSEFGGGKVSGCDVFVAFSVAGGTGAGIFLDYLHLINHAFQMRRFNGVKIYPLVVMPSSFASSAGGGREADLNAARALVDLFRLVDGQNAPTEGAEIGDLEHDGGLGIRYPGTTPIRLRTGILPTAFLFSPTAGIRQDDLRRSIVSLVMSLIGTELGDGRSRGRTMAADDDYQTFAASFINRGVHRSAVSPTGIGRQGVSTSLVASMTAPMDQLADLVAGRLLRRAVTDLLERPRAVLRDDAVPMIRRLFADANLEELWERKQLDVPDPDPLPRGGRAIEVALGERVTDMQRLLADLQTIAVREAASMADRFAPRPAIDKLLQSVDPFVAERLVKGVPDSEEAIARAGFLGMLNSRARAPQRPPGVTDQPPKVPRIKGRLAGMSPARWGDDDVRAALHEQDTWYRWRCHSVWHEAWREQQQRWQTQADTAGADLGRLVNSFVKHAERERKVSAQKGLELYEDRTGISYLLPPQRTLNHFYEDVVTRLVRREGLRETEAEDALLLRMIDGDTWRAVHTLSRRNPDGAVATVKAQLEGRITRLFAESGEHLEERPLLPAMSTLLAAAAGDGDAAEHVSKEALELFGRKLTGLLPVGFTPEGTGPLRVLVTYPRVQAVDEVQEYLGKALQLPSDAKNSVEYRGVESDSVTVVLFRSEMSLTQVPEARKVLRQWARAKDSEQAQDVLRWRQRLGFRDSWMVSSEEDRRVILHRLLCCMWNGQVDVLDGETSSPVRVRLRLFPEQGAQVPGVRLRLGDYPGGVSSWAELLRSYERWTVLDDERTVEDYCRELMGAQPTGLARNGSEPHPLFVELVEKIAPRQLELLDDRRERGGERVEGWVRPLREFWAVTLPAALDTEFGDQRALQPTLRTLLDHVRGGSPAPSRRSTGPTVPGRRRADEDDDWGTAPRASAGTGAGARDGDRHTAAGDDHGYGAGDGPGRVAPDDRDDHEGRDGRRVRRARTATADRAGAAGGDRDAWGTGGGRTTRDDGTRDTRDEDDGSARDGHGVRADDRTTRDTRDGDRWGARDRDRDGDGDGDRGGDRWDARDRDRDRDGDGDGWGTRHRDRDRDGGRRGDARDPRAGDGDRAPGSARDDGARDARDGDRWGTRDQDGDGDRDGWAARDRDGDRRGTRDRDRDGYEDGSGDRTGDDWGTGNGGRTAADGDGDGGGDSDGTGSRRRADDDTWGSWTAGGADSRADDSHAGDDDGGRGRARDPRAPWDGDSE